MDKFYRKVDIDAETGCWNWMGYTMPNGYGQINDGKRVWLTHMYAYVQIKGEYDRALDLDHLCRNRACCNPDHLEPVTRQVNLNRGLKKALVTHCPRDHEYSEENTRLYKGSRFCRTCQRDVDKQRRLDGRK